MGRHHKRHYDNNSSSSSSSSSSSYSRRKQRQHSRKQPDTYSRVGKDTKIFCYFGMAVGILLVLISIGILIYFNGFYDDKNSVKVTGTVTIAPFCTNPQSCTATIEYEYNGQKYTVNKTYDSTTTTNKSTYYVGEKVTLYIDPNNPSSVKLDTERANLKVINIVFSVLLVIGLLKTLFFYAYRKNPIVCGFYGLSWFIGGRR